MSMRAKQQSQKQYELALVPHEYDGQLIQQRQKDGYINATAMCQAAEKKWSRYYENVSTKTYLHELAQKTGLPEGTLVQSIKGGDIRLQGTWVHPQVAIHLAQWLSPTFAVQVSEWVYEWMNQRPSSGRGTMPYHLRRYVANQRNVPHGHFSVLNEITMGLIAPLEAEGYTMPESMMPDISQGKMFARWVSDKYGVDTKSLPTYLHTFEDGRPPVRPKAYPNEWLAEFRRHFTEVWLPERAQDYFQERDPAALAYLPKLLPKPSNDK